MHKFSRTDDLPFFSLSLPTLHTHLFNQKKWNKKQVILNAKTVSRQEKTLNSPLQNQKTRY